MLNTIILYNIPSSVRLATLILFYGQEDRTLKLNTNVNAEKELKKIKSLSCVLYSAQWQQCLLKVFSRWIDAMDQWMGRKLDGKSISLFTYNISNLNDWNSLRDNYFPPVSKSIFRRCKKNSYWKLIYYEYSLSIPRRYLPVTF